MSSTQYKARWEMVISLKKWTPVLDLFFHMNLYLATLLVNMVYNGQIDDVVCTNMVRMIPKLTWYTMDRLMMWYAQTW